MILSIMLDQGKFPCIQILRRGTRVLHKQCMKYVYFTLKLTFRRSDQAETRLSLNLGYLTRNIIINTVASDTGILNFLYCVCGRRRKQKRGNIVFGK